MRALAALSAYTAHPDPPTRIANSIALLVGLNGPFYPLYVWFLVPEVGLPALLTMLMSPVFLMIPWLSRRNAVVARAALPVAGLANTVWTAAVLGPASGVGAFVFPCIALTGLCWRENRLMLALLGIGLAAQQAVLYLPADPLSGLGVASQELLGALNVTSVGALLAFIVITLARELRSAGRSMTAT